jgi:transposase
VIETFVDALDLPALGFEGAIAKATGRSYHPAVLLRLYIYGYLNCVQSSRRLEREAGRNVELMWLLGRLVPDHKTIADSCKENGAAIGKVCAHFRGAVSEHGAVAGHQRGGRRQQVQGVNRDKNSPRPRWRGGWRRSTGC